MKIDKEFFETFNPNNEKIDKIEFSKTDIFDEPEIKAEILLNALLQNVEICLNTAKELESESKNIYNIDKFHVHSEARLIGKFTAQNNRFREICEQLIEIKELRNQSNNQ